MLQGDLAGTGIRLSDTGREVSAGPAAIAAVSPTGALVGTRCESVLKIDTSAAIPEIETWVSPGDDGIVRDLGELVWDKSWGLADRTVATATGLEVWVGEDLSEIVSGLDSTPAHALYFNAGADLGVLVWLERDFSTRSWIVQRKTYMR